MNSSPMIWFLSKLSIKLWVTKLQVSIAKLKLIVNCNCKLLKMAHVKFWKISWYSLCHYKAKLMIAKSLLEFGTRLIRLQIFMRQSITYKSKLRNFITNKKRHSPQLQIKDTHHRTLAMSTVLANERWHSIKI